MKSGLARLRIVKNEGSIPSLDESLSPKGESPALLFVTTQPGFVASLNLACHVCDTAETALQMATNNAYKILFIDYTELRDRISGTSVIRSLRQKRVSTPAYLMSDAPTISNAEYVLKRGASGLISRNSADIKDIIRNIHPTSSNDDVHHQRRLVNLLADYTGPAAQDQASMVLSKHVGIELEEFALKLSDFIPDANERHRFLISARKVAVK